MLTLKWFMGDRDSLADTKAIRKSVFVDEMGVCQEEEDDGQDASCIHLVAYENCKPIATGRVMITNDDFILGRLATVKESRNQGIATGIVEALVEACVHMGGNRQILTAPLGAKGFFEKIGFTPYGDGGGEAIQMEHFGGLRKCGGCGSCA